MSKNKNNKVKQLHRFLGIKEPIVGDATQSVTASYDLVVGSEGSGNYISVLSPRGISAARAVLGATTTGSPVTWTQALVVTPPLNWLYNTSFNFEMYRVTRATLVIVGNGGSTITGKLAVMSTPDVTDYPDPNSAPSFASVASGGKAMDLALLSSKEVRVPLDIDSSWKKVSGRCAQISSNGFDFIPINTLNDLAFSKVIWKVVGAPANANVATFTLDYDVEFKNPTYSFNF